MQSEWIRGCILCCFVKKWSVHAAIAPVVQKWQTEPLYAANEECGVKKTAAENSGMIPAKESRLKQKQWTSPDSATAIFLWKMYKIGLLHACEQPYYHMPTESYSRTHLRSEWEYSAPVLCVLWNLHFRLQ